MNGAREQLKSLAYDYVSQVTMGKEIDKVTLESAYVQSLPNRIAFRFFIEKWASPSLRGIGSVYQYVIVFPEIVINGEELTLGPFRAEELKKYLEMRGVE